jgi:uncharacterized protein YcsI (UPF0317 family)
MPDAPVFLAPGTSMVTKDSTAAVRWACAVIPQKMITKSAIPDIVASVRLFIGDTSLDGPS